MDKTSGSYHEPGTVDGYKYVGHIKVEDGNTFSVPDSCFVIAYYCGVTASGLFVGTNDKAVADSLFKNAVQSR